MDTICYMCNKESSDCQRNLADIKSQHTETPISDLIKRILGDFMPLRKIDDKSNCICVECLQQFNDYDWMCQQVIEQESRLRDLLLTCEPKQQFDIKEEPIEINADTESDSTEIENQSIGTTASNEPSSPQRVSKLAYGDKIVRKIDAPLAENAPISTSTISIIINENDSIANTSTSEPSKKPSHKIQRTCLVCDETFMHRYLYEVSRVDSQNF